MHYQHADWAVFASAPTELGPCVRGCAGRGSCPQLAAYEPKFAPTNQRVDRSGPKHRFVKHESVAVATARSGCELQRLGRINLANRQVVFGGPPLAADTDQRHTLSRAHTLDQSEHFCGSHGSDGHRVLCRLRRRLL